jgi:mersacidin/lichenicidin family type 2 lantibiotic
VSKVDIVRAWKDEEYRASLTDEERAQLPEHPAGLIELANEEMKAVLGGQATTTATTKLAYCGTTRC